MGKLIVIEGLDGSGKSTQLDLLLERLKGLNIDCRSVSFPDYESDSSALVRMYLAGKFGKKPDDVNPFAASVFYRLTDMLLISKTGVNITMQAVLLLRGDTPPQTLCTKPQS